MSDTRSPDRRSSGGKPAGHVEFDSRGNSVWRWHAEPGDSTSILLHRLENDALALEATRPVPALRERSKPKKASRPTEAHEGLSLEATAVRGFDPYNRG